MLKCKTWNHKLSRRKHRHHAFWRWSSKYFLDTFSQARETEVKINKCDYINLKSIWIVKEITRKNVCLLDEKRYLQTIYQIRGYIQNVRGTHTIQHQIKQNKQKTQLKNNLRIRTDIFPKKTYIRKMGTLKKKRLNLTNH